MVEKRCREPRVPRVPRVTEVEILSSSIWKETNMVLAMTANGLYSYHVLRSSKVILLLIQELRVNVLIQFHLKDSRDTDPGTRTEQCPSR